MGDKDKLDITDSFVPYDDHTSQTKLLKALGESLGREVTTNTIQVRQAKATLDEMTKRLPVVDRDQPEAAHVSWTQRVLSWFRRG